MAGPARVALVTGASAGIGLHTALGLAGAGFRVVMAGRDAARLEAARRMVAERAGSTLTEPALADFASLAAVRQLAESVLATHGRLDLLVNNAGLTTPRFQLSEDGYELTLAVNHLAPFLLTNLLLDRLRASSPSRIVTVASQAHRGARLNPAAVSSREDWSPLKAYGRSKLCNILFTRALARRLHGSLVVTACLHPGVVATAIGDSAGGRRRVRVAPRQAVSDHPGERRRDLAVPRHSGRCNAVSRRLLDRPAGRPARRGGARRRIGRTSMERKRPAGRLIAAGSFRSDARA
jgi:retinol dehydrogenase-12